MYQYACERERERERETEREGGREGERERKREREGGREGKRGRVRVSERESNNTRTNSAQQVSLMLNNIHTHTHSIKLTGLLMKAALLVLAVDGDFVHD